MRFALLLLTALWLGPTQAAVSIPPDQFIPIAEDTGLIIPMGEG